MLGGEFFIKHRPRVVIQETNNDCQGHCNVNMAKIPSAATVTFPGAPTPLRIL